MKVEVNGNEYDIELLGNKARINNHNITLKMNQDEITISEGNMKKNNNNKENEKKFHLDFLQEGESAFMIINGMAYNVSKSVSAGTAIEQIKAPISGQIIDVSATSGKEVKKGEVLVTLEAMKMENHVSSPIEGRIKEIKVKKGQAVKSGDVLLTFE